MTLRAHLHISEVYIRAPHHLDVMLTWLCRILEPAGEA